MWPLSLTTSHLPSGVGALRRQDHTPAAPSVTPAVATPRAGKRLFAARPGWLILPTHPLVMSWRTFSISIYQGVPVFPDVRSETGIRGTNAALRQCISYFGVCARVPLGLEGERRGGGCFRLRLGSRWMSCIPLSDRKRKIREREGESREQTETMLPNIRKPRDNKTTTTHDMNPVAYDTSAVAVYPGGCVVDTTE